MTEPEDGGTQDTQATQEAPEGGGPRRYSLRRAPRYGSFILTGAVLGVLIAAVLTVAFPNNGDYSAWALFGYLAITLAMILGLVGALAAIFVERPRR